MNTIGSTTATATDARPAAAIATQATLDTPVGTLLVEADDRGLSRVGWTTSASAGIGPTADRHPVLETAIDQLRAYFAGDRHVFDLPIDLSGLSRSQQVVLRTLADGVSWGETISYGELAARSGGQVPARAIGSIMGSNPVPIVIGCHRVVAADGLGGYSGGEPGRGRQTKLWLLEHEGALPPALV